ncbi:acetoacetate decarboxylase family protein [Kitasatospora sp. NPDC002040]|uniref:acetoacetate decarboxylase family protein n=1 Tax=Kitasatospora sp. NPDC002040 TaxID=3154661 RepID=UPI0033245D3D
MYEHPAHGPQDDAVRAAQLELRDRAREIVRAAEEVLEISARTTAALAHPALTSSALRHPATGLPAQWALLRALTSRQGLGFAVKAPEGLMRRLGQAGEVFGQESLAALIAVSSLRLRIAATTLEHPELLEDPGMRRLTEAVVGDRDLASLRALRALIKDRGSQQALAGITPIMPELFAIRALLDEDPGNDEAGWALATGRDLTVDPLKGIDVQHLAGLDAGEGAADPVELSALEQPQIARAGTLLGYLRNIAALATDGRILIQDVRDPDGTVRYVLQAPGMAAGKPRNDSPQDFVGAWNNLFNNDSPYTRGIRLAMEQHGIPDGAELALIGHSEGGISLMNLAQDVEFSTRYRVTHIVCIGSPIDNKTPADPDSWVATVTNQHDLVPILDGRGTGSVFNPHPDWYEVDYTDATHGFPQCHTIARYLANLEHDLPEARERIDAALTPYRHPVLRSQAYQLKDRAHPPQGYPFMTVPTTPAATSAGPVELPVRYYDSTVAVAIFAVDAQAAARVLPGLSWLRPTRVGRKALVALSWYEHRCVSLGPYSELSLAVLVNDLWRPRPYDVLRDLLRRADVRRTGRHVVDLLVTTPEALAVGREIWGQPGVAAPVEVQVAGRRVSLLARDPEHGGPLVGLTGAIGPATRVPQVDSVLYGRPDRNTVRTMVRVQRGMRLHPAPRARLLVGDSDQQLARHLRELGLAGARPLFVMTADGYLARRSGGTVLPR